MTSRLRRDVSLRGQLSRFDFCEFIKGIQRKFRAMSRLSEFQTARSCTEAQKLNNNPNKIADILQR